MSEADGAGGDSHHRSRREQFQHEQQRQLGRQSSLERALQDAAHVRSQSPNRLYHHAASESPSIGRAADGSLRERRPSLEQIRAAANERRPSLERANCSRLERRPSLEMLQRYGINQNVPERRPSLERLNYSTERRPSLERLKYNSADRRPSLERLNNYNTERSSSLERQNNYSTECRPSSGMKTLLEHQLSLEQNVKGVSAEAVQGINTITPQPCDPNTNMPKNWDPNFIPRQERGEFYRLVPLNVLNREYVAITVDFEEAGLKVISVERLQNPLLLENFNHERSQLLKKRPPGFNLNERYLYHGTQANKERICEEGLDHRLSFQGCFGRGIYFSDNPRKCVHYATTSSSYSGFTESKNGSYHVILVCRVLLGDSKIYTDGVKDPDLKREPEKHGSIARGGWRYYDSVQGVPIDYPEFVVYDKGRSMIEYIVTFEEVAMQTKRSQTNLGKGSVPSLYKTEPVTLPIPEEELDKLYMLGPDSDSDGSCDEHTREVERLRDNVKRGKAKRLGIPYRPPTEEEKRYERMHWKRVCYYSCPPNSPLYEMMIMKKKEEKAERRKQKLLEKEKKAKDGTSVAYKSPSKTSASCEVAKGAEWTGEEFDVENESVAEVLSNQIAEFLTITTSDNVQAARRYLMENDMDMDKALCQYYHEMD